MQFEGEKEKSPLNSSRPKTTLCWAGPLEYGCWTCAGYQYAHVARTVASYVGCSAIPWFLAQRIPSAVMLRNAMSHLLTVPPYTTVALLAKSSSSCAATSSGKTAMLQRCNAEAATEWVSPLISVELLTQSGSMILIEKWVSLLVWFSRLDCVIPYCPNEKQANYICPSFSCYVAHWTQLFWYPSIIPWSGTVWRVNHCGTTSINGQNLAQSEKKYNVNSLNRVWL